VTGDESTLLRRRAGTGRFPTTRVGLGEDSVWSSGGGREEFR